MNEKSIVPVPPNVLAIQQQKLQQAKELAIEDRTEALNIVIEVLRLNQNNTEAVWLYVNLIEAPEQKIKGLQKLLRLEPENQKARTLLSRLETVEGEIVPHTAPKPLRKVSTTPVRAVPVSTEKSDLEKQNDLLKQMLDQQRVMLDQQRQQQPVIHIVNSPTANANSYQQAPQPVVAYVDVEERNQTAFVLGVLAGIFLTTFGVSHIFNNKVGTGIMWMLLGWFVWAPIALVISAATGGIGACLILPLHILFAYNNAKEGSQSFRSVPRVIN